MRNNSRFMVVLLVGAIFGGCWADFPESRLGDGQPLDKNQVEAAVDIVSGDGDLASADLQPDVAGDGPSGDQKVDGSAAPDQTLDGGSTVDQTVDTTSRDQSIDRGNCPIACDSCQGNLCRMACANGCTCPSGWECDIVCGDNGCLGPIDCSGAARCAIDCGSDACTGEITCSTGDCTVNCGLNSCTQSIFCGAGGFCDVTCDKGACKSTVDCGDSCGCSVSCDTNPSTCKGPIICPSACGSACGPSDGCDDC